MLELGEFLAIQPTWCRLLLLCISDERRRRNAFSLSFSLSLFSFATRHRRTIKSRPFLGGKLPAVVLRLFFIKMLKAVGLFRHTRFPKKRTSRWQQAFFRSPRPPRKTLWKTKKAFPTFFLDFRQKPGKSTTAESTLAMRRKKTEVRMTARFFLWKKKRSTLQRFSQVLKGDHFWKKNPPVCKKWTRVINLR